MDLHQTLTNFDSFLCNSSIINVSSKSTAEAKKVSLLKSRFAALKEQQQKTLSKYDTKKLDKNSSSYKAKRDDSKKQSKIRKKELFYDCKYSNKLSKVSLKGKHHLTHKVLPTGSSKSRQRCNIVHDDILYSLESKDSVEYSLVDPSSCKIIFKQTEHCIPIADSVADSHLSGYETCLNDSHPLSVTTSESSLSSSCESIARQNSDSLVQLGSIRQDTPIIDRQLFQSNSCSFNYSTSDALKSLENKINSDHEVTSLELKPPNSQENCYDSPTNGRKLETVLVSQEKHLNGHQKELDDRFENNSHLLTLLKKNTGCSKLKNNEALNLMLLPSAKSFDRACSPLLTNTSTSSSASRKTFLQELQCSFEDESLKQSLLESDRNYDLSAASTKDLVSSQSVEGNDENQENIKTKRSCMFSNKLVQTSNENLASMEPTSTELSFAISSVKSSHTSFMDKVSDISYLKRQDKGDEDFEIFDYVSSAEQVAEKNFPKSNRCLSDKKEPLFANPLSGFVKSAKKILSSKNQLRSDTETCHSVTSQTKLNQSENRTCSAVENRGQKVNCEKSKTVLKKGLSCRDQNKQYSNTATKISVSQDRKPDQKSRSKLKSPKAVTTRPTNCKASLKDYQLSENLKFGKKTVAKAILQKETRGKPYHIKVGRNHSGRCNGSIVQDQKVQRSKFGNYSFTPLTRVSSKLIEDSSVQKATQSGERKSKRFKEFKSEESDFQEKNVEIKDVTNTRKAHSDCCNTEDAAIKKQVRPARLTVRDGASTKLSSSSAASPTPLTSAQKIRAKKRQSLAASSISNSRIKPPSERPPAVTKLASRIAKNAASEREKSVASSGSSVAVRRSSTNLASATVRRQQKVLTVATARKSVRAAPSAKPKNASTVKEKTNASKRPSSSLLQRKKLLDEKAKAKEQQEKEEQKRREEAAAEEERKRREEHERNIQMKVEMLRKRKDQLLQSIEMQRLRKKATDETFCEVHDQQSMTSTKLDILERIFDMRKKDLSDAQNRFIDMRSRISELDNVIKQLDVTNYFEPTKYQETLSSFEEKFSQLSIDIKHKEDEEVRILSENESEKSLLVEECAKMRDKVMEENRACFELMQKYKQHKKTLEEKQQQQQTLQVASSNETATAAASHSSAE